MPEQTNWIEVELAADCVVAPELLVAPSQRIFGEKANLEFGRLKLRVANHPIAVDLWKTYHNAGKKVPASLEVFQAYDVWLLAFAISAIDEPFFTRVQQLGFRVRYGSDCKAIVIDLFPRTEFVRIERGTISAAADVTVEGGFDSCQHTDVNWSALTPSLPQLKVSVSAAGNFAVKFTLNTVTPNIVAIGRGDSYSEWLFTKHDKPLVGDHVMLQTIILPRDHAFPKLEAQVYAALTRFGIVPVRMESPWVRFTPRVSTIGS